MRKSVFVALVSLLAVACTKQSGSSYDDCLLKNLKGATGAAVVAVNEACVRTFATPSTAKLTVSSVKTLALTDGGSITATIQNETDEIVTEVQVVASVTEPNQTEPRVEAWQFPQRIDPHTSAEIGLNSGNLPLSPTPTLTATATRTIKARGA